MDNLINMIAAICRPTVLPVMELASIWLETPIMTSEGKTKRITEGNFVYCELVNDEWELKDCLDKPNFIITSCKGRATSDFEITVRDLSTHELHRIKL